MSNPAASSGVPAGYGVVLGRIRITNKKKLLRWVGEKQLGPDLAGAIQKLLEDIEAGERVTLVPALPSEPNLYWVELKGTSLSLLFTVEPRGSRGGVRRAIFRASVVS